MNMSESLNELATSLATAQMELENASKNAANPHFKSKYADLAEVLNTVRPVFAKYGLSVSQFPSFCDGLVTVRTVLLHKSGQWMAGDASAPVTKLDAQGVGSAITYLRRYSLAAVAGVAQEDDDGNAAVKPVNNVKQIDAKAQEDEARLNAHNAAVARNMESVQAIKQYIAAEDVGEAAKCWYELSEDDQAALWRAPTKGGVFTTKERDVMKNQFSQYKGIA
jgi:hypothetical protein